MTQANYITPQGLQALKEELKDLLHKERPQLVQTVAWAASNGDRSENADYIYGKRRLREIDRRLRELTKKIEDAQVIDPTQLKSDKVIFGATVEIEDEEGTVKRFQIVGEDEIDIERGRISWKSPIAKALLGRQEGDEVVIRRPSGAITAVILKIEFT